jgi:hypothetical protein
MRSRKLRSFRQRVRYSPAFANRESWLRFFALLPLRQPVKIPSCAIKSVPTNVCTEEIVHALDLMGYDTGVDLESLVAASIRLSALIGHETPSQSIRAGRRLDLHARPKDFDVIKQRAQSRAL